VSFGSIPLFFFGVIDLREIYRISFIFIMLTFLASINYDQLKLKKLEKVIFLSGIIIILFYGYFYLTKIELFRQNEIESYIFRRFQGFGSGDYVSSAMLFFSNFYLLEFILKKRRVTVLILFLVSVILLGATGSRWALIALVISLSIILFTARGRKTSTFFGITAIILVGLIFLMIHGNLYKTRLAPSHYKNIYLYTSGRWFSYQFTMEKFIENLTPITFLFGNGSNKINILLEQYGLPMVHNDYIMIFFNYGIVGLILWLWFLYSLVSFSKYGMKNAESLIYYIFAVLAFAQSISIILMGFFTLIIQSYVRMPLMFLPICIVLSKLKYHQR
jgi:O-antigen ligase